MQLGKSNNVAKYWKDATKNKRFSTENVDFKVKSKFRVLEALRGNISNTRSFVRRSPPTLTKTRPIALRHGTSAALWVRLRSG